MERRLDFSNPSSSPTPVPRSPSMALWQSQSTYLPCATCSFLCQAPWSNIGRCSTQMTSSCSLCQHGWTCCACVRSSRPSPRLLGDGSISVNQLGDGSSFALFWEDAWLHGRTIKSFLYRAVPRRFHRRSVKQGGAGKSTLGKRYLRPWQSKCCVTMLLSWKTCALTRCLLLPVGLLKGFIRFSGAILVSWPATLEARNWVFDNASRQPRDLLPLIVVEEGNCWIVAGNSELASLLHLLPA